MTGRDGLERRRLLGLLGASATAAVAGCLVDYSEGEDGSEDDGDDQAQVYEPTHEDVEAGPIEFVDTQGCAVCSMTPTNYPRRQSQLVHENGQAAVFDSPGCLFAYIASSTPDSPIADAWTTDFGTRELIDATEAHFVLITDEDAADDPMGIDPRPFADREDAMAFLDEWEAEELTEDDVMVGIDDVDLETASIYRGKRLPDE
ncbi:nitrous oxide reductase accessory protein NosL [Natrinema salifodinae]|uniref:Nitrous oxide reductase accessory protein NosL n=1 Tax=Natrinema salifodinae TaxID=1202768 RepID=A0A1I0NF84_9EURY|nr:nitrous oxide reductase accessory protein NosL [Natrinema salifodinae]SEV99893.1 Nitrous oxide reductase accessory protein NosL [Natrinema salifodinae]